MPKRKVILSHLRNTKKTLYFFIYIYILCHTYSEWEKGENTLYLKQGNNLQMYVCFTHCTHHQPAFQYLQMYV
jgi:hypothetical protein